MLITIENFLHELERKMLPTSPDFKTLAFDWYTEINDSVNLQCERFFLIYVKISCVLYMMSRVCYSR